MLITIYTNKPILASVSLKLKIIWQILKDTFIPGFSHFDNYFILFLWWYNLYCIFVTGGPRPGGSVVGVSDSWPSGCEFETRLRRTFFPAYFYLSPLLKHVRKVVGGFGKKVVLVLVWESQETHLRLWPPWYDLSCLCGVKPQYNQPGSSWFRPVFCIIPRNIKITAFWGRRQYGQQVATINKRKFNRLWEVSGSIGIRTQCIRNTVPALYN